MNGANGQAVPDVTDDGVARWEAALAESRRRTAAAGPPPKPGVRLDANIASAKAGEVARERERLANPWVDDQWTCDRCGALWATRRRRNEPTPPRPPCERCADTDRRVQSLLGASGVGPIHRRLASWAALEAAADADQMRAIRTVRAFLADAESPLLLIVGPRGCGKTQLASAAVAESCRAGHPARIVTLFDALAELKGGFDKRCGETEADFVRRYTAFDLLALDECAVRTPSAWGDAIVTALIDRRYSHLRKTILLANATPAELQAALGPSVLDRANEGGSGGLLAMTGASWRGRTKGGEL